MYMYIIIYGCVLMESLVDLRLSEHRWLNEFRGRIIWCTSSIAHSMAYMA